MSDPVMGGRRLGAGLSRIVRSFRRRRRWRHVLSMTIGVILLIFGSAIDAVHLTHHTLSNTPAIGAGRGLYAAGVLLFSVPAVLVFAVMSVFAGRSGQVFYQQSVRQVVDRPAA